MKRTKKRYLLWSAITVTGFLLSTPIYSGTTEQAERIYNNLNGTHGTPEEIDAIAAHLDNNMLTRAGVAAIDAASGSFYHTTLRNMINVWANENRSARYELNDLVATVIGMTRDGIPFDQILYGDIVYISDAPELPPYSHNNNDHYLEVEAQKIPLHTGLVRKKQSELTNLPSQVTAGALTTRGFAKAYYQAGTNRAAFRFTMMNFMCRDMEQLTDTSRPDFRVRQDVARNPGGDPATYKSKCVGCHAGMDGMAGAFAYMDFQENSLVYNPLGPRAKYFVNSDTYLGGHVTENDSWINLWTDGPNEALGWRGATKGRGVRSFGRMVSQTEQFSRCMAQQALAAVCRVEDAAISHPALVDYLASGFENDNYNLKHLFAQTAIACRGE